MHDITCIPEPTDQREPDNDQMTEDEAIAFHNGGTWKGYTDWQIVDLQLSQKLICVDWQRFHEATEAVLGRRVAIFEFAHPETLRAEIESKR